MSHIYVITQDRPTGSLGAGDNGQLGGGAAGPPSFHKYPAGRLTVFLTIRFIVSEFSRETGSIFYSVVVLQIFLFICLSYFYFPCWCLFESCGEMRGSIVSQEGLNLHLPFQLC